MNKPIKFAGSTIRLSDTHDQYARRTHINVRNGKVTLVHRWKDYKSPKSHTQRVTLTDEQVGRLVGALSLAAVVAAGDDAARETIFSDTLGKSIEELAVRCEAVSK